MDTTQLEEALIVREDEFEAIEIELPDEQDAPRPVVACEITHLPQLPLPI